MTAAPATAALLTAPARGGIAVIALAGAGAAGVLASVFRPRSPPPQPGKLALGWIVRGQEVLDEAIVTVGDGGAAEINVHGGPHVARKVLTLLSDHGVRIAGRGRVDPNLAASARGGGLDNPAIAEEMMLALRRAATPLAASAVTAQWAGGISALASAQPLDAAALRAAAAALPRTERLLTPAEVVVAGPPNVGKSALTNALVGRNVCIVSDAPGTTRDWVRSPADACGVRIWLTDTAGLWQQAGGPPGPDASGAASPADPDAEAVRRAWGRIESADVVVCVVAGPPDRQAALIDRIRRLPQVINVSGKCDVLPAGPAADVAVSGVTLAGVEALRSAIRGRLGLADLDPAAPMVFTRRQADLLARAADAVDAGDAHAARAAVAELLAGNRKCT